MEKKVLDHGYLRLVEHWGSDERVVEAARMSTDKGFLGWGSEESPGDERLLRYLWNNKHTTPFEMAGLTVEVKAPILVFREWHRHRTQSYNEMSARYVPLPDEWYMPSEERLLMTGGKNKQASSTGASLSPANAHWFMSALDCACKRDMEIYHEALRLGVPKELARCVLPVNWYSKMRASANLRNWLAFLHLRMDVRAQWEIRQYANAVGDLIENLFPRTWELFAAQESRP